MKSRPEIIEEKPVERELVFTGPFNKVEEPVKNEDEGEDSLLNDDEFDNIEQYSDQVVSDDGMMELRSTKQRLQQQAKERQETFETDT